MKTLRFIGMALFAVLMSVNFASCSSDEDDEPQVNDESGAITKEKKLVEITEKDKNNKHTSTFTYDNKNRLKSVTDTQYSPSSTHTYEYTWGNDIAMVGEITFKLKNGLLIEQTYVDAIEYNSSNQLVQYDYSTLTWNNGKITKVVNEDRRETIQINYSNKTCEGYFPLMVHAIGLGYKISCPSSYNGRDIALFLAHPEFLSLKTKQLPNEIIINIPADEYRPYSTKESYILEYSFTNDGYIESCTITEEYYSNNELSTGYPYITIINFKWQ